jgi:HlyD family secretion protein
MIRKYVLSLLALAGFVVAVLTVRAGSRVVPAAQPVVQPAKSTFESFVAGAGIVEASSRNIEIGSHVSGVVQTLYVEAGDAIGAVEPLFTLDERDLKAQLAVRHAALNAAQAQLQRLESMPRPEDIPPADARVQEAKSALDDAQSQLDLWESLPDKRAVSQEALDRRRYAVEVARARLTESEADLALLKAGAWQADLEIARAEVASSEAQVQQTMTDIERLTVRSPVAGRVLQVNARQGEFAQAGALETPLILVGAVEPLQVRVDVDEHDAWRVRSGAKAVAFVRGNSQLSRPLTFVRFEPFVVPKVSLTGASTERVDTRVLQVLYSFEPDSMPVFVGQQMDVFIEAPPVVAPEEATSPAEIAASNAGGES